LQQNIINLFLKNTPESILAIKKAISTSDWENIQKFTHKIKPSLTIIGLNLEITGAFLKINQFAKEKKNLDQIKTLFIYFEAEIEKAYLELRQELTILSI
jgi:HPt (histidine-containing phosphotransfer) domain-containing protein